MKDKKRCLFQPCIVYKFELTKVTTPYIMEKLVLLMGKLYLLRCINNKLKL